MLRGDARVARVRVQCSKNAGGPCRSVNGAGIHPHPPGAPASSSGGDPWRTEQLLGV